MGGGNEDRRGKTSAGPALGSFTTPDHFITLPKKTN